MAAPSNQQATGRFFLFSLLATFLACLVYLPGLPGEFLFDDHPNIVSNESIQLKELSADGLLNVIATPQVSGQMRGLPTLTFALDYWRGGGTVNPATFKATNIFIHGVTLFALAWLLRSVLLAIGTHDRRAHWLAIALALAWAVHPLLVSSVLYAVQRLQTMGTLFLMLALLTYMQARRAQLAGQPGRTGFLATALLWALAMSCKEDSALLPAYTLALELTVLRFAAANSQLAHRIKRGYFWACVAGTALYLFVIIPHYWSWDAYGGRDFSSPERLLTQARVLCMYLWQIVLPLPSHMPFYYDWLQPSRGLLQPWTTLPAIALIASLLVWAWRVRHTRPLFALGIFLFFSAHFITANVVGLELAYEHRNHFALIGAVLAVGSLLADVSHVLRLRFVQQTVASAALLLALASATALRAHSWSNNLLLSEASVHAAPHSARAWIELCASHFRASRGIKQNNTQLDAAIAACQSGTALAPYSLNNTALLVVLKTLKGNVTPQDWALFQHRLETVQMSWDNQRAPTILTYHAREGVKLDKAQILKALTTLSKRAELNPFQTAQIGYFIMDDLNEPDQAMPYFIRAVKVANLHDPFPQQLASELEAKGRPDLAQQIKRFEKAKLAHPVNPSRSVQKTLAPL